MIGHDQAPPILLLIPLTPIGLNFLPKALMRRVARTVVGKVSPSAVWYTMLSQRRNDLARLATAVTNYQTNNNGKLPPAGVANPPDESAAEGAWPENCISEDTGKIMSNASSACNIIRTYMNSVNATENEFKDPEGNSYGLTITDESDYEAPTTYDRIAYIVTSANCANDGMGGVKPSNSKRDYAITMMLEGSGLYCNDSK